MGRGVGRGEGRGPGPSSPSIPGGWGSIGPMGVSLDNGVVFARDYRVVRPLSEGGMGAVYVVEQLSTGSPARSS